MSLIYEKVHQVIAYYDGPREGIADFEGRPHLFRSERDYGANVFFFLTPLSEELFQLAMGEKGNTFCLVPDPVRQFRVRGRIRRSQEPWDGKGFAPMEVRWRRVERADGAIESRSAGGRARSPAQPRTSSGQ